MRRGLIALVAVAFALLGTSTASATTVGYANGGIPPAVVVNGEPGQTNTIVWAVDPTFTIGPDVIVTDVTAPTRVYGRWPDTCHKLLRTVRCDFDSVGLIYLGDGADTFMAASSNDNGYYSTCCWTPQFTVFGGPGNDRIIPSLKSNADIDGGSGNDLIVQGPSRTVHGGPGDDTIVLLRSPSGPFGSYSLSCGDGRDTIAVPASTPTPPDCERRISIPQALADLPPLPLP